MLAPGSPDHLSGPPRTRRRLLLAGLVGAVGLVTFAVALVRVGSRPLPDDERAVLEARAAVLDAQLALAKEDAHYLVLDPQGGTLTLFQGGAPLRLWPVAEVEAGARRLGADEHADWRTRRWDGARVDPPVERRRRTIVSDSVAEEPDLAGAEEWVPPTPEEAIPTPSRFVVHYEGGLGLEVVAVASDSSAARATVFANVAHRLGRLRPSNWDRYRIRVRMDADEAGRLYRALPDSSAFLAIIPRR